MKTKKLLIIIALFIISFVCFADNTNVKADNNDSWIYETTIDGTMTINYTVAGTFGEHSQTAIDENGNYWRADRISLLNTTSFDVPVKIAVKRNTAGKATYSMTVKTDSRWEMMDLCGAPGASEDQWSWLIVNGNAYFDFTAAGEHDLTNLEASDEAVDLTSKGCTFKVDKIYDNNPDWIIDKENWTTQKVNSITLKFTYPKIYTVSYYVRNEKTDGSWGDYWYWYKEYHKYGDTYSTTGYKDDAEYQQVSASGTVDDDKTIYLDAYKKWYTIKYYVRNENADGSWGDYWYWYETSYRYGSTYHTDGYGNDESGADNDVYNNFCIRGTVTGNKDWYIDAYRRWYNIKIYVKNENVDGSWSDAWLWIDENKRYGETYSYTGYDNDAEYEQVSTSGTVAGNINETLSAYRKSYRLNLTAADGIEGVSGEGVYKYGAQVTVNADVKNGYHWHISDDCHTDTSVYATGWYASGSNDINTFLDGTTYNSQTMKFTMPGYDVNLAVRATNNSYTVNFDPAGGTGEMTPANAVYDVPVTLPANTFTRITEAGTSTFLYWKFKDNNYVDNSVVNNLTSDFNGNVTLTAVWDDTPVITAQDRYFTVDDSQSGKITLEELLSTAKVTDDRDADITDKLTVKNYHPENYTQFKTDGAVKIVYTVTDNSGNKAEVSVMAYIVDTTAVEEEKNTYVRFIGPDYYQESYENGGLEDNSIWRNDPEYAATLERAMQNRLSMTYGYNEATFFNIPIKAKKAASESRDHLVEQWVFTKQDIKAVKEYVNEHGIGNMKEPDALAKFRIQFAHCKKQ
mgnify:FL=1